VARLPAHLSKVPVGRERLSRETLSALQRERIIDAAIEVFAKRGYQSTTVDNIVSAAKIGVGSFYAHFDGKDDCLLQCYAKIAAEARERIDAVVDPTRSWAQQTCAVLYELLAMIAAEPLKARVVLLEVQTGGPAAVALYTASVEEAIGFMANGREAGKPDPLPPATFEEATVSGIAWLLQQRLTRGELDGIADLFPEVAEVVLEPYLGAERSAKEIADFTAVPAAG
jgi:AcrR family transcriptional regulator